MIFSEIELSLALPTIKLGKGSCMNLNLTFQRRWIFVGLWRCFKHRLRQWVSSTHPTFTFSRKTRRPQRKIYLADSHLLQINFVILVVSVVGSTKVNATTGGSGLKPRRKHGVISRLSSHKLLQPAIWGYPPMWCFWHRAPSRFVSASAVSEFCIQGPYSNWDQVCSNRGAPGHYDCVQEVWRVPLWVWCCASNLTLTLTLSL